MERFSYSKLSCFESCGWQYKLIYEDKHFINESAIATDFGTLLHHVEELIATDIKNNIPLNYDKFMNVFINGDNQCVGIEEILQKYPEKFYEKDKSDRTYGDKADYYLNEGIYRLEKYLTENPELEIIGIEKEFNLTYEYNDKQYDFHGFIDRIFRNKETNEIIIEDIKTYAVPIDDASLTTPLQFVIYNLAVQNMLNSDKIICKYDLPLCDIKQQGGTKGFVNRGLKKINKLLDKIANKEFIPNPTPLCHWCCFSKTYPNQPDEAKNLCPYYSLWTKQNKVFQSDFYWQGLDKHQDVLNEFLKKETKKDMLAGKNKITIKLRG